MAFSFERKPHHRIPPPRQHGPSNCFDRYSVQGAFHTLSPQTSKSSTSPRICTAACQHRPSSPTAGRRNSAPAGKENDWFAQGRKTRVTGRRWTMLHAVGGKIQRGVFRLSSTVQDVGGVLKRKMSRKDSVQAPDEGWPRVTERQLRISPSAGGLYQASLSRPSPEIAESISAYDQPPVSPSPCRPMARETALEAARVHTPAPQAREREGRGSWELSESRQGSDWLAYQNMVDGDGDERRGRTRTRGTFRR